MYSGDDEYEDATERDGGVFIGHEMRRDDDTVTSDGSTDEIDLGEYRDPDLWGKQIPLIQEDEDDGLKLNGFPEEDIPRILDAMGDEAADAWQESPNGDSATGDSNTPEHGGFPERK